MKFLSLRSRSVSTTRRPNPRRRTLTLEILEDRVVPAGNLLVTVAGSYPTHQFREYTPTGALVRTVNVPPTPGSTFDYARDLVQDPAGNVSIYNGTFTPYLATYRPATSSWSQITYPGWSTVSNLSYGGLALFQNFIYATDMATAGAMQNGVVRFNMNDGSAIRFGNTDFTDLNIGLDGMLYALNGQKIVEFDPISTQQIRTITLPSADYRGITVNARGEIFTAAWNNVISHFTPNGVLMNSITLNSSTGAPFMFGNPDDIDVAADGTIAIGSWSGHIVQMTSNFTNISYIDTGTFNTVFVTFANTQGPPPGPALSVNDVSVQNGTSGVSSALFTVSLSTPSNLPVTANFTATPGTAVPNTDFYAVSGTVTFAPNQTSQTVPIPIIGDPAYDAPETFYFNFSNPSGATLGRAQGTGTIVSAVPAPLLTVGNATVVSATSGTTYASFTVSLSAPSPETTTVSYQTSDGSGWAYSDYTLTSGTLTFAPGQTSKTVLVPILADTLYDAPETFYLNLSNPVNATLARAQGTGTILSSVAPPSLTVGDISVTSATSGSTTATFTVSLAGPTNETTMVNYSTADGSAAAGSDYFATSSTLMFLAGQTSKTVTVSILGDAQPDPNETFTLNLSNPVNATIARSQGTATIVSSVVQTPSLTVGDITVINGTSGTTPAVFTLSLSAASSTAVTVNYTTADGLATAGSDYIATSGTLTFAPGQTSQTVTVPVIGDPLYDFQETFSLQLSSPTGATLARSQATATIVSSLPPPSFGVSNVSVVNGTSGTTPAIFTVSLSAGVSETVTVNYTTANGTATAGTDFQGVSGTVTFAPGQTSQTVTVPVIGDARYDNVETFTFQLLGMAGGGPITQGTGTIVSGVPAPSLTVADVTVAPGTTGTTPAVFTVSLSAASGETTTVNYATADGTALAGTDYQAASGTLTFAPGQTTQTVTVTVLAQPTPTAGKTFTLNLSNPSNASLARAQATGTIVSAPIVLSAATAGTATDIGGDGTFEQLMVTNSVLTARNVDATYSNIGTPLENRALLEYNVSSIVPSTVASVTFNFGEQFWSTISQYVQIYGFAGTGTLSLADATSPGVFLGAYDPKTGTGAKSLTLDRSAVMSLVGSSPYLGLRLVGVRNTETTIAGTSDPINPPVLVFTPGPAPAVPTLTASNFIVNQGYLSNDYRLASFPLNLTQPAPVPVTIAYQIVDGTATTGNDYTVAGPIGFVTIPAGQVQGLVTVNVLPDNTYEPANESFYLQVTGVSNATLGNAQGQGTLVSTAPLPTVSVLDNYASVTESHTGPRTAVFYVLLSNPSDQTITVNYSTADLTATAGSDYQAASGSVTFAPGQIAQAVGVTVLRDPLVEPLEQYAFNLSGAVNATLGSNGIGGITSGEHAPVANAGSNQTVNEGATVQFDGSSSSDADGDPLTFTWGFGDGSGATGPQPTHVFADDGTYTVTLSVSDGYNVTTTSLTVTVLNVAPTAAVSGPADAVPGQTRMWTFSASDPSVIDQAAPFTYQITWGDGSTQTVQGSGSGVQVAHTFTTTGPFSVSATATDSDNGTGPAAGQTVTVVSAELQGGDLLVGGTTGNDTITIQPADASGTVDVVINGQDQGTFVPTGQVVVYGQAGNDLIQVVPLNSGGNVIPLTLPVLMFAGNGNDTLDARGVSGPTVLVGGGGNNTLYGGSGRNILIAGSGSSVLVGGGDDDLLIAGVTTFDANLAALVAIRNEWGRSDADYLTRIDHLNGSLAGGLNGGFVLNSQSVMSNGGGNTLTGGPGLDWYFAALGSANPDVISDLEAGEVVTSL